MDFEDDMDPILGFALLTFVILVSLVVFPKTWGLELPAALKSWNATRSRSDLWLDLDSGDGNIPI